MFFWGDSLAPSPDPSGGPYQSPLNNRSVFALRSSQNSRQIYTYATDSHLSYVSTFFFILCRS